jgi:predicted Zn-dependent protease
MQHAHHILLHVAEQGGVPLLLAVGLLSTLWIVRFARSADWRPAGFGVLYLWLNGGADLTVLYEPVVLVGGLLLGLAGRSLPGRRRGIPGLMVPYFAVWLTSLVLLGNAERTRRDGPENSLAVSKIARTVDEVWGVTGIADSGNGGHELAPHGRCARAAPLLVDQASLLIAQWRPHRAESLLQEAVRRDPTGVIAEGGGRARVMLAVLQRQTGRGRLARRTMQGLRWSDADAATALATLEYYTLRKQEARVESVLKHVLSTTDDPVLRARFKEERARRQSLRPNLERTSQDVFKEQVERLLASGLTAGARERLQAAGSGLDRWLLTLLWSRVYAAEGDMGKAVALAAHAVAQSGGSDAARWELVEVLLAGNRTDEALVEAGKLVQCQPRNPGVWLLRGQTLLAAGRATEALNDVVQAQELGADAVACGIARSQALRLLGRHTEAEHVLVRLLRERPGMPWPAWELASWAESEGRLSDAARWARIALARAPGDHGSRVLLGRVLAAQGNTSQARRQLRLVVEDPRAGPGWQADARREMAQLEGKVE